MVNQMKTYVGAFFVTALLILGGCTTVSEAGYYWGDYASTLYAYQRDPSQESLDAHAQELRNLIDYANENDLSPGILAELGYIEEKRGNSDMALQYYESEMSTYPESRLFLERLTADTNKEEG